MGLKLLVSILVIVIVLANLAVFLFVSGIPVVDRFKTLVLNIFSYLPGGQPLLFIMIISIIVILAVVALLLRGSRGVD